MGCRLCAPRHQRRGLRSAGCRRLQASRRAYSLQCPQALLTAGLPLPLGWRALTTIGTVQAWQLQAWCLGFLITNAGRGGLTPHEWHFETTVQNTNAQMKPATCLPPVFVINAAKVNQTRSLTSCGVITVG